MATQDKQGKANKSKAMQSKAMRGAGNLRIQAGPATSGTGPAGQPAEPGTQATRGTGPGNPRRPKQKAQKDLQCSKAGDPEQPAEPGTRGTRGTGDLATRAADGTGLPNCRGTARIRNAMLCQKKLGPLGFGSLIGEKTTR